MGDDRRASVIDAGRDYSTSRRRPTSPADQVCLSSVAVQLHQLVEELDGAIPGKPPKVLLAPFLRLVEELAAASSGRTVAHSDPTTTDWVLFQRAADHFHRTLVGTSIGQRSATLPLRTALDEARRTAEEQLAEFARADDPDPPRRHRLIAVVTTATLGRMTRAAAGVAGGHAKPTSVSELVVLGMTTSTARRELLDSVTTEAGITDRYSAIWWLAERASVEMNSRLCELADSSASRAVPMQRIHVEVLLETQREGADHVTVLVPRATLGSITWWRLWRLRRAAQRRSGVDVLAV